MRRFLIVMGLVCLSSLAFGQTLSPRQFTEEVAQALRAAAPGMTVEVTGDLDLKVRRDDGSAGMADLTNTYKVYREAPGRRAELVSGYVTLLTRMNTPSTADHSRIVPLVRSRAFLAELQKRYGEFPGQGPVFEDFGADLVIVYGEDGDKGIRYLSSNERLPVDRDELRAFALRNLVRIVPKVAVTREGEGLFTVGGNGDYDASLMLLDQIWTEDRIKVKGDIVIAIPVRNLLLVTGTRERKGLKAVRAISAKLFAEGPYSQTETLFVRRKGAWARFGRKSSKAQAEE